MHSFGWLVRTVQFVVRQVSRQNKFLSDGLSKQTSQKKTSVLKADLSDYSVYYNFVI